MNFGINILRRKDNTMWEKLQIRNRLLYLLVLTAMIACMISTWIQENSKELICHNLVEGGLLDKTNGCPASNYPPEYIPVLFPADQVDIDFVMKGMEGIEIVEQSKLTSGCQDQTDYQLVSYGLDKDILGFVYIVRFKFCNQILHNISYSD